MRNSSSFAFQNKLLLLYLCFERSGFVFFCAVSNPGERKEGKNFLTAWWAEGYEPKRDDYQPMTALLRWEGVTNPGVGGCSPVEGD